ncbi:MAG TPA: hypothetical protein VMB49_07380 [Acidobacteriaceae bacterium]|nr:hypothetical protein [Acidobacteriaceae bacterium]
MAKATDERSHNQPSHEAQVKGGQHSHQGSHENQAGQPQQSNEERREDSRSQNQPSHEAQVKGGQHSHSTGQK